MEIEEFSLGDSFIHRMDPRVKIIVTLVFSVVVAVTNSVLACAISLVFPLILIILARVNVARVLMRLAVVNGFVLFLWIFLPFTYSGEVIHSIGPFDIHREGVLYASLLTLKSNSIILTVIALLGTSQVFTLVHALSHMGVPNKLVHLFFFCFRYVHVIHIEYHKLLNAMKMRAFRPRTNVHTYRTYAYLMGMLLVRSFDRSQRILQAMNCRGFKEKFYILHHYEMRRLDYLLAAWSVVFSGIILTLK